MVNELESLHDDVPVFVEKCLIRKEISLEGDGKAADHVDALLFDACDVEMHVDQLTDLVLEAVFWGELGE